MAKKQGSPVGELSSGYESNTVKEYDPKTTEGQIGKEHEEEVAKSNNWTGDKRDEVGRAASKKARIARKLRRIAREIEAMEAMNEDYSESIEDAVDQVEDEATGKSVEEAQTEEKSSSMDEAIIVEATHPIEHDSAKDDPGANMSSQTGDDEWISIGPGSFSDKRDEVGKAD